MTGRTWGGGKEVALQMTSLLTVYELSLDCIL